MFNRPEYVYDKFINWFIEIGWISQWASSLPFIKWKISVLKDDKSNRLIHDTLAIIILYKCNESFQVHYIVAYMLLNRCLFFFTEMAKTLVFQIPPHVACFPWFATAEWYWLTYDRQGIFECWYFMFLLAFLSYLRNLQWFFFIITYYSFHALCCFV